MVNDDNKHHSHINQLVVYIREGCVTQHQALQQHRLIYLVLAICLMFTSMSFVDSSMVDHAYIDYDVRNNQ